MATSQIICGICELRKISRDPVIWCSECDEALCTDCSEHHALSKSTRQHETVPIEEYKTLPPFILNINQFCNKHNEKYTTFCKTHDCPCCRKCAVENHNKCTDIVVLEDVIHHAKTAPQNQEIMAQLIEMTENIKKIRMNRKDNAESLKKQRKMIEKEISEKRKNINDHLDSLQKRLIKELTEAEVEANNEIRKITTELQKRENVIKEFKDGLDSIKKHASDLQAFLGIKQIQLVAIENEKYLQSLVKNEHVNQTNLSCRIDESINKSMLTLQSFGEIIVNRKPSDLKIEISKHKQAHMFVAKISPKYVQHVTLKLDRKIQHKNTYIRDCCLLSNGSIILSSQVGKYLFKLNKDGSNEFTIDVNPEYPAGVTCIDNSTIAVAVDNTVRIINIDNRSIQRTTRGLGGAVSGITYKDGKFLCGVYNKGILGINLDNDTVTTVVSCPLSSDSYVKTNDSNIFYTDVVQHTVTCCDMTGTTQWVFKDTRILKGPCGITVDRNGFIYVVGFESNNAVAISPDGKQYKELLSSQDGLDEPTVIYYDRSTYRLLVANFSNYVWFYNIE